MVGEREKETIKVRETNYGKRLKNKFEKRGEKNVFKKTEVS